MSECEAEEYGYLSKYLTNESNIDRNLRKCTCYTFVNENQRIKHMERQTSQVIFPLHRYRRVHDSDQVVWQVDPLRFHFVLDPGMRVHLTFLH